MKNIHFHSVETRHGTSLQTIFLCLSLFTAIFTFAQAPSGYYAAAENKSGEELRTALYNIIKSHNSVSYSDLWQSFYSTDMRPDNGKVWDMYSDRPGGTPAYYFTFGSDQCGNYSGEGDCYNREHSVPKSWFGGSVAPMYTDLFHLIPTDGFVNSKRSNLPFGKVINATWTSTNGSKVGTSNISSYSGQVFEPIDSFKGDFARIYFYMATCYKDKNLGVETQSNFSGGDLKPWAKTLLLQWAALDPVSQKEIDRNNAVFQIQHNRNPFIDYPELAEKVFGNDATPFTTSISDFSDQYCWSVYPNPTTSSINIQSVDFQANDITVEIHDIAGRTLLSQTSDHTYNLQIDVSSFPDGLYLMKISSAKKIYTYKIVKQ
jgi:endonuclease I